MAGQKSIVYPKVTLGDVIFYFWRAMKGQRLKLLALILSLIAANIAIIIAPLFYKKFFDVIVTHAVSPSVAHDLVVIIIQIALLHMVFWALYRVAEFCNNVYQPHTMARLKQQSYDYLIGHAYSFFAGNFVGALVQKVNRFGRSFERLSDDLIWNLLPLFVRIFSILIVVFFINKWIDLVIFAWIIIFLSFNIFFSRWKLTYDLKAAAIDSRATGYLADTITNQNAIVLFNGAEREREGYRLVTKEQARLINFTWNLDGIINGVQAFLGFAIEFLLFYFAIRYWSFGIITVGVFALLQAYAGSLIDQLWGFTRLVRDFYQAYADAKEMAEVLKLPHEIQDIPTAQTLRVHEGKIEFKNLSFRFNETRSVLENVNLVIKPGEKVAIVGPSGAGKTTFVRLLLRFYIPSAGAIFIDGQNIAKVTQKSLRENIAMVPQDTVLFHRTLAENIGYGREGATRQEIERACYLAHCDEFIKDLPQGLETYVGERGVKLSGGERQRVAIARAILKSAPILVLDEATSSLDSASELLIQDALAHLMEQKTAIVIAHRLSTIQKMDRIIVIDQGTIVEQGSHHELLANKKSLYTKLWNLQAGGFLKDEDVQDGQGAHGRELTDRQIQEDEL